MTEADSRVNWLAIGLLVALQQGLGAGWYALWGDQWMTALGRVEADFAVAGWYPYAISAVLSLVLTYGIARFWLAMKTEGFGKGAAQGVVLWIVFILTYQGVHTSFELIQDPEIIDPSNWIAPAIDMGMSLVTLALTGGVLAAWRGQ